MRGPGREGDERNRRQKLEGDKRGEVTWASGKQVEGGKSRRQCRVAGGQTRGHEVLTLGERRQRWGKTRGIRVQVTR